MPVNPPQDYLDSHPEYAKLTACKAFASVTPEEYTRMLRAHPHVNASAVVQKVVDRAELSTATISNPLGFLGNAFGDTEVDNHRQQWGKQTRTDRMEGTQAGGIPKDHWSLLLLDYCPKVFAVQSRKDAERWFGEIRRIVPDALESELADAIRWAKRELVPNPEELVTPDIIASWLRRWRHSRKLSQSDRAEHVQYDALAAKIRSATPAERWDVICSASDLDTCRKLDLLAQSLPGGVVIPDHAPITVWLRQTDKSRVGDDHWELDPGDTIKVDDEMWDGVEWREFGKGHAMVDRKYAVRYRATRIRRRKRTV